MASRRDLKRDISYVIGDIFTECLIYKELVPGTNQKEAEKLIVDLLRIDNEFLRVAHSVPRDPAVVDRYKKQVAKMVRDIDRCIKQLNA